MGNMIGRRSSPVADFRERIVREIGKWEEPVDEWVDKFDRTFMGGKRTDEKRLRELAIQKVTSHLDLLRDIRRQAYESFESSKRATDALLAAYEKKKQREEILALLVLFMMSSAGVYVWRTRPGARRAGLDGGGGIMKIIRSILFSCVQWVAGGLAVWGAYCLAVQLKIVKSGGGTRLGSTNSVDENGAAGFSAIDPSPTH